VASIVVCEGLLRGRAGDLVAAFGERASLVDPFVSEDPDSYRFASLVRAFGSGRDIVAVGGSVGSAAALAFARAHPERCAALVLLHPVVLYGRRGELVELATAIRARGLDTVWRAVFGDGVALPRREATVVAAALEAIGDDVLLDGPDDLGSIAAPTLLVARAGDPLHAMEIATAYWRLIPTTRMVNEVPGDVALWDRPAELAARIDRFLHEVGVVAE
jgi:pimeloyl-ACP methyl ester carboxylesterase